MRTTSGPELTTLAASTQRITLRVKVANGSGTMIDLSNWVEHVTIDQDVDQPVSGCTIEFTRASGTVQSLAPLRTDSTLNVNDAAAYSPLLDLNRLVTVEVATTTIGATIVAGDYKLMFKGTIDVVNFERSPVSIICRDQGAPLVDRWIEAEATYGSGGGTAIQTVMQNILDDVFGGGVWSLYVPVSPGFNIVTYRQQKMSVMDALQDLAQVIGWDIRIKWDDGTSTFRLTLSEPPRTKTTPDHTFAPSTYFDITRLNLDITNIRNVVSGSFRDMGGSPPGNRATVTVSDSTSITKYGRRFFFIQEADVSPIDSSAEMTTMVTAALADLKDPKAEQEVDTPFFWPADISDLYRYSSNSVHYNSNQDIAVVELTHDLSRNHHRTRLLVRGTPIGQYATWLGRGGSMGGPTNGTTGQAFAPYPFIVPLNTEADDTTWDLRFNAINGTGGGGTNLTYTIKSKKTFGTETTLVTGNASAFPDDVTITRDLKQDSIITFTVTDAATGMFAAETFVVPAYVPSIGATGNLVGSYLDAVSVTKDKVESRFRCKTIRTANQSIADSTPTNIAFNGSDLWDVGALHDLSTNNDRLVVPVGGDTGVWAIDATVRFDANATGRREVRIWQMPVGGGAGSISAEEVRPGLSNGGVGNTISIHATGQPAAVGDFWVVEVWQNSTAALNLTSVQTFAATHSW